MGIPHSYKSPNHIVETDLTGIPHSYKSPNHIVETDLTSWVFHTVTRVPTTLLRLT